MKKKKNEKKEVEIAYHVYEKQKKFQSRKCTTKVNTKKKRGLSYKCDFWCPLESL